MSNWSVSELVSNFPVIPWRKPVKVSHIGNGTHGWACRICVANLGLRADQIEALYPSEEDCRRHIEEAHPS